MILHITNGNNSKLVIKKLIVIKIDYIPYVVHQSLLLRLRP